MTIQHDPILRISLSDRVEIVVWTPTYMETIIDGETVPAQLVYTPELIARAVEHGYAREEAWRMHVEHELLHTLIAFSKDLKGGSPTLRHVAGLEHTPDDVRLEEEGEVMRFQAVRNELDRLVRVIAGAMGKATT